MDACSHCRCARTDGRSGVREGGSRSAASAGASSSRRCRSSSGSRLGRIRPLGCNAATSTGEASSFLAPNVAAAARCDALLNAACGGLVSDNCASGLAVVASLGRRRTSTVNEGTARLNVVLPTAHRSCDSCRRRRPSAAKRDKAMDGHCGNKPPIPAAGTTRISSQRARFRRLIKPGQADGVDL